MVEQWHFSRHEDAGRIVAMLGIGLVSAISIIEPRRRGKTTFLQSDLAPAALRAGYLPIYVNLAASPDLEAQVSSSIEAALQGRTGLANRLRRIGAGRVSKVTGKASLATGELGAEVEIGAPRRGDGRLAEMFSALVRAKTQVLFMLDEVHVLADVQHSPLAWALRSLLDSHRDSIKVVATSSSATTYDLLVTGEKKPFKAWFSRVALTPLAGEFVAHLASVVEQQYPRHAITRNQIVQAFDALGRSPKFVRDYLNARILDPRLSHAVALQAATADAAQESGYDDAFSRLMPLQRAVVFALLDERKELFSEEALRSFATAIQAAQVSKSGVQRAARSLAEKGWIIRQDRGDYRIADSLFEQWLQAQLKAGLLLGPRDQGETVEATAPRRRARNDR